MTLEQVYATINSMVPQLAESAPAATAVPIITGRLRSSVKWEKTATGYRIYIDEGNMELEEWEALTPEEQSQQPWGFAPYAEKVNNRNPYWTRVAFYMARSLQVKLGGSFSYKENNQEEVKF